MSIQSMPHLKFGNDNDHRISDDLHTSFIEELNYQKKSSKNKVSYLLWNKSSNTDSKLVIPSWKIETQSWEIPLWKVINFTKYRAEKLLNK